MKQISLSKEEALSLQVDLCCSKHQGVLVFRVLILVIFCHRLSNEVFRIVICVGSSVQKVDVFSFVGSFPFQMASLSSVINRL